MKKRLFLTLLFLLWALPAFGVIVNDATTASHAAADGESSFSFNHTTCGGGGCSNMVAFACITISQDSKPITAVTYNGVSMGTALACVDGWGFQTTCLYGLVAPATGTHAFAATFTAPGPTWSAAIATFSGVDQATPFDSPPTPFSTASYGDSDADVTVTSAIGDWVVSCYSLINDGAVATTIPVTVTQTLRGSDDGGGTQALQTYISTADGAATVVMGARFSGDTYGYQYLNHYAINMNAAAAAASGSVRQRMIFIP